MALTLAPASSPFGAAVQVVDAVDDAAFTVLAASVPLPVGHVGHAGASFRLALLRHAASGRDRSGRFMSTSDREALRAAVAYLAGATGLVDRADRTLVVASAMAQGDDTWAPVLDALADEFMALVDRYVVVR